MNKAPKKITNEPVIKSFLGKMPAHVADSFTEEQLAHIFNAIGSRSWGKHAVDLRGTVKLPLYRWRFYYVILFGRNHRELTRQEKQISLLVKTCVVSAFLIFSTLLGLLVLYLIKSALGIDLLPGFSLGIWDWFKGLWS